MMRLSVIVLLWLLAAGAAPADQGSAYCAVSATQSGMDDSALDQSISNQIKDCHAGETVRFRFPIMPQQKVDTSKIIASYCDLHASIFSQHDKYSDVLVCVLR